MKSVALLAFFLSAAPKTSVNDEAPKYEEIDELKPRLRLVSDGKGHYLAYDSTTGMHGPFFYGDGKSFYLLRSPGGGGSDEGFNVSLWDPHIDFRINGYASFDLKMEASADGGAREANYSVTCPPKTTRLAVVSAEDSKKLLGSATFYGYRWQRRPHKLARDDKGNYYFVDCARDERIYDCSRDWRLYVGPRGKLKLQQMTNIVSDTVGQIFSTKGGELRLVLNDENTQVGEATTRKDKSLKWVNGKDVVQLVNVPVDENARMIYTDLGVYDRERLGTPCDDL
jgi:hypothetical protein